MKRDKRAPWRLYQSKTKWPPSSYMVFQRNPCYSKTGVCHTPNESSWGVGYILCSKTKLKNPLVAISIKNKMAGYVIYGICYWECGVAWYIKLMLLKYIVRPMWGGGVKGPSGVHKDRKQTGSFSLQVRRLYTVFALRSKHGMTSFHFEQDSSQRGTCSTWWLKLSQLTICWVLMGMLLLWYRKGKGVEFFSTVLSITCTSNSQNIIISTPLR